MENQNGNKVEKQRVRINVSTTAKGLAQFDVTVEMVDEQPEALRALLEQSLEIATTSATKAGFELAK